MEKETYCACRSTEWKAKCSKCERLRCNVRQDLSSRENFGAVRWCIESVPGSMESIADALIDIQRQIVAKEKADNNVEHKVDNIFHCALCGCVYIEPMTLHCGHTLCKTCILPGKASVKRIDCKLCGSAIHGDDLTVNVLVANLIQKWCPEEYEEVKVLEEVQRLSQGSQEKLIETLSEFLRKRPDQITALKWRSQAFFQIGNYEQALADAELACDLRPFLPSVFHQKGVLLDAMGNYEKASQCFLRALALEPDVGAERECRLELLSCLSKFLSSESDDSRKQDILPGRLQRLTATEFKTNKCYSHIKVLQDAENSQTELLNELQSRRQTSATLARGCSKKRPFEESGEHSLPCTSDIRTKCYKVSTERDSISSNLSQAAILSDMGELECKICYCVLYQPVTTACGHTFCRECIQRALDHRPECPCCRRTLNCGIERNTKVNKVITKIVEKFFPEEYAEREKSFAEEKARWKGSGLDANVEVPIFVCLLAFPSLKYPLHIFEPRYRLMIRRCTELGSRMFGMCSADTDDPDKSFADYGTMLHIESIHLLPDGRSIVHTTAKRRFRVVSRSVSDGYNTAKVEWLNDEVPRPSSELQDLELKMLNADCYQVLEQWFSRLQALQQTCITNAIGPMPRLDRDSLSSPDGPAWLWWGLAAVPLQDKAKLIILSMNSLAERLQSLRRFLKLLLRM